MRLAAGVSSFTSQETVTLCALVGTAGEWLTLWMTGGRFAMFAVFTVPGVPPDAAVLEAQFCPLSLLSAGLRNSKDLPPPFAGVVQSQPPYAGSR